MTQNANESLPNVIWNFCPKAKYISPQSVLISTAIAVTVFNEGELCLYGIMHDMKLHPSHISFRSICKREQTKQQHRNYTKKANRNRRARRQKLSKLRREQQLLRLEGGRSYKSSSFGTENFTTSSKPRRARRQRRVCAVTTRRVTTTRGKGVKRRLTPAPDSNDSCHSIPDNDFSNTEDESDGTPKKSAIFATSHTRLLIDIARSQDGQE